MTPPDPATPRFSPLAELARFSAQRPWTVVILTCVVLALAFTSLSRLRVSASLDAMLGSNSAAALAFQQVMNDFNTGESLLALVEPTNQDPALEASPESKARTAAFAHRYASTLLEDPRTRDRIHWARATQDPSAARFAAAHILPNAPFYLGEDATRDLLSRFDPTSLAEQFARNESLISSPGPAGDALSRNVLRDPLRLFELATAARQGAFTPNEPGDPDADPPPEFSIDGRAVLVRIAAAVSRDNLNESARFVQAVRDIADELCAATGTVVDNGYDANPPHFRIRLGGADAIAATSSRTIRADAILSTLLSIGLIYGLFVFFTRRWLTPLIIGVVAGVGIIVGFGVHAIGGPTVSPLAAAVAALLAGLGVDYGIHTVAHFDALRAQGHSAARSAHESARAMALPITTNCFTSIFGFVSLWPSSINMLSDFAKLGTAGLIGAWLAAFTLLPALLVLTHKRTAQTTPRPPRLGFVADSVATRPRLWFSAVASLLVVVALAATFRGQPPRFEGNLSVLHPQPNKALATTDEVIARFTDQGEIIPVLISVKDPNELLPAVIDAANALASDACRDVGVSDVLGLHRLLPDPRQTEVVSRLLSAIDPESLLANFDSALNDSIFEPAAYSNYRAFLAQILAARHPPTLSDIAAFPSLHERLFPRTDASEAAPTRSLLVVRLTTPLRDRDRRAQVVDTLRLALVPVPAATLAGLAAISTELEDSTRQDLPRSMLISAFLVLAWLTLVFRSPADVLLALVPLIFAGVFTIAFITATGSAFNAINSIAIPLLYGIAVDAGVFLVSVARRARAERVDLLTFTQRLRPTMHAVLLASATTCAGFLSLSISHTPAVVSLGVIAAVGIASSFFAAAGILVPLLLWRATRHRSVLPAASV
jgi:predicted RND superfamily exporter protein